MRVAIGLALLAMAGRGIADTYPRPAGIKITHYTFDIGLNDASNEFVVAATVDVRFLAAGITSAELDLCQFSAKVRAPLMSNGFPDPCAEPTGGRRGVSSTPTGGKGMIVTAVTSGGQPLAFRHENDRVHISLPHASKAGEELAITVSYHGAPATGILIGNNKHGDRGFFSNPWPHKARNYLASVDHPSAKAPVTTIVTAPRHYQVISNGHLVEQTDLPGELRRTVWKESSPICTCLMSLGVAPFAVEHFGEYHGIPLSSWVYPQEKEVSFRAFRVFTQPVLEFYIDHIGPYSYEKLAQVEANGIVGGMELASDIYYGYGENGPGRQLIAHEMAHQWFGDSAAEGDWDDVWLSEGFATYFALLYEEFQDGHDAFLEAIKRSKGQAIRYALAHPDSTIVHQNLADFSKVIVNNAQIYQGGAQALHNLRGVVGTGVFWAGIRLYYSRYQNGNANTDDFRRSMEDACRSAGEACPAEDQDLTWLFHELLNRGGVLQIQGDWHYDRGAKQVQVTLQQTQQSGLYRMPIELAITLKEATETEGQPRRDGEPVEPQPVRRVQVLKLERQSQSFTFPVSGEPVSVALDPDAWVMMQATFERK